MLIVTLRTDKPMAEIAMYDGVERIAYYEWQAHRQLAETIHQKLRDLLASKDFAWHNLEGIAVYKGPGSFTGLRIGMTVGNALAAALQMPIVTEGGAEDWALKSCNRLLAGDDEQIAIPEYGSLPHITAPKH